VLWLYCCCPNACNKVVNEQTFSFQLCNNGVGLSCSFSFHSLLRFVSVYARLIIVFAYIPVIYVVYKNNIFWTAFFMKFSWCICLNWFLFQVILYSGAIVHALCWLWCFQMNVVGSHVRLMVLNCHINKYWWTGLGNEKKTSCWSVFAKL
jgi:hypothetical protein